MAEVLRLNKIAGTAPAHFRVVLKGLQGRETYFGNETDIRGTLAKAGLPNIEIDRLFTIAKMDSANRSR